MVLRFLTFFVVILFMGQKLASQTLSNRGKEFWLGYGFNYNFIHQDSLASKNGQELKLYISAEKATTVTVSISNTTFLKTFNIPANSVDVSVTIPKVAPWDARMLTDGLMNRSIRIISTEPIAVFSHQFNTMVSGASMLMPKESYGYTYYSVNYAQNRSGSKYPPYDPTADVQNGDDWYSWFYVIATEDDTRVNITPSDTTKEGWLPGKTYSKDLNKGEMYAVFGKMESNSSLAWKASKDMTGSKIVSVAGADGNCHPIAVFSGSGGIRLCYGDGGEYMGQQMFPLRAWGTRYVTYHMINNTSFNIKEDFLNIYRVCVSDPNTIVKRNGVVLSGLINNFYYEFASTSGDYIESDKPVLVSQYTPNANHCKEMFENRYGDPEMIYLSPIEQGQKKVICYIPSKAYISIIFASIYLPTAAISSLRVNGNTIPPSRIIPHPTLPGYSIAGAHLLDPDELCIIESDSTFNAYIYGLGYFESYGFSAGTNINDLTTYSSIRNTVKTTTTPDTITCPKTPFRAEIKVAYELTSLKWHLSEVDGLLPSSDKTVNNPVPQGTTRIYGRNYFIYTLDVDLTLSKTGEYKIPFSYTSNQIDHCGGTEKSNLHVIVRPGPIADFDTLATYCSSDTINLVSKAVTTGYNVVSYRWDFGDGTSQLTKDGLKRFPDGGLQPVRYRIFTDFGCVADTLKRIKVLDKFSSDFTITGKKCEDSVMNFNSNKSLSDFPGAMWHWDLGAIKKDSSKVKNNTQHIFKATTSEINVKHWIITDKGCVSDTSYQVIGKIYPSAPTASLAIVSDTLCPGSLVKWEAKTSFTPSKWHWDLGNGIYSSNPQTVYRTYTYSGNYTTQLNLEDQNGCGAPPASKQMVIYSPPIANAGVDQYVTSGKSTLLEPLMSPPNNFIYEWYPPIGLSDAKIQNPVCTPLSDMTYALRIWDKTTLCSAIDSVNVIILESRNIPNTFSPNKDGTNDFWELKFLERCMECRAEVYTTNGTAVWRSSPTRVSWDGRLNGRDLPVGTYYYVIKMPDAETPITGFVTIMR